MMMTSTGPQKNRYQIQLHRRENESNWRTNHWMIPCRRSSQDLAQKTRKSSLKQSGEGEGNKTSKSHKDSPTIASQATSISQLTEQVNEIKQTNKTFLARFDQLAEQMAALLAASQPHNNIQRQARGHASGSVQPK